MSQAIQATRNNASLRRKPGSRFELTAPERRENITPIVQRADSAVRKRFRRQFSRDLRADARRVVVANFLGIAVFLFVLWYFLL